MKRIVLFLLFFTSLLVSSKLNAQHFNLGIKEGATTSSLSGLGYKGFNKFGYIGGGYVKVYIAGTWTAAVEVLFTQKGSRRRADRGKGDFNEYFLQLNYIEFPLLFQYHFEGIAGASIEFGPGYSKLLKTKEILTNSIGEQISGTRSFKNNEITYNIGINYIFYSHFALNFRWTNSAIPVFKYPSVGGGVFKYGQKNTVLTLCLGYEFGK